MMKVFVTGATGYIGKRVVRELISLGHSVVGLTRSENGAKVIKELGAVPVFGELNEPQKLSTYAKECSGIIHLAMDHNFSDYERSVKMDREIVNMFCREVMGTNKAFVFTTATFVLGPSTGDSFCDDSVDITTLPTRGRGDTEKEAMLLAKQNPDETARICAVRPAPFVYGEDGPGFLKHAIECSKKAGYSGYMGDGTHFSTACNVDDMAHLYVLALTKGKNGSSYHGTSDFFNFKDLANSIGKLEGLPIKSISQEDGEKYYEIAFFAYVSSVNHKATSTRAEKELGWKPLKTRGILYDVEHVCKP